MASRARARFAARRRRSRKACPRRSRSPSQSRSKNTIDAGVCLASSATREAAGWMRCWSASKSSPARRRDHDLAVEHAARRELREQRLAQVGEVAVQRLLVAALEQQLVPVAEDERAKAVPLRLEDPVRAVGDPVRALGEHRRNGGIHCELHARILPPWLDPRKRSIAFGKRHPPPAPRWSDSMTLSSEKLPGLWLGGNSLKVARNCPT